MGIHESKYGVLVLGANEKFKEEKSLVNRLNWCNRHKGEILKHLKDKAEAMEAEERQQAFSMRPIFEYLLNFDRIAMWNPQEDGEPLDTEDRLLAPKDVDRLLQGRETGYKKGGISIFRLHLICYGIAGKFIERNDYVKIGVKTQEEIRDGVHDAELIECAKAYHAQKERERLARQEAKEEEETEEKRPTVDDFLNGEIDLSEIEDTDLLDEWYNNEKTTRGKKGQITRRKKELVPSE